jgi:hypothetical protein
VNREVETLLRGNVTEPAAAAVGGYYLLRVSDLDRLHNWPANLTDRTEWMPDGLVIRAWQLIREQQDSEQPSQEALDRAGEALDIAREDLLEAVEWGIPVYTEGLRLLIAGLKLLAAHADDTDPEVRDAINRLRPFVAAADLSQSTTTYTGSSPMAASTLRAYGRPKSLKGLVYLHNVRLQDLIDLGLLAPDTVLSSLLPFATTSARVTSQGILELSNGKQYTDPSKAAAEAGIFDPWFIWSLADGRTLGLLRQQARSGEPTTVALLAN